MMTEASERSSDKGTAVMESAESKESKGLIKRLIPLAVLVLGLAMGYSMGWHEYLSFESLKENRETLQGLVADYGFVAVLGFIALYAVAVAFSFPGATFLTLASGFLFGTVFGGLYTVVGATLGATAIFLAARTAFGDILRARAEGHLAKMSKGFEDNAFSYLLVLRLVPLFPFWLVNLVPAFTGIQLRSYVMATFLGIIPGSFVFTSVGSGLGALFDRNQEPDLSILFTPEILLPILGLACLSMIPVVYKKFKKKTDA
ncbi:TVP38/TMEM64 family protein [Kiloniella sp. b19]|uniref:TVP38/TMEM64 family protein n=1 Tax=Kiloniella sp. GXU_MW_B19 TaxID=3141326 RepID=UPI0031E1ED53